TACAIVTLVLNFLCHCSPAHCHCLSSHAAHPELLSFPTRRSSDLRFQPCRALPLAHQWNRADLMPRQAGPVCSGSGPRQPISSRSEEHTSELQSRENLVCRLLLEKKKTIHYHATP